MEYDIFSYSQAYSNINLTFIIFTTWKHLKITTTFYFIFLQPYLKQYKNSLKRIINLRNSCKYLHVSQSSRKFFPQMVSIFDYPRVTGSYRQLPAYSFQLRQYKKKTHTVCLFVSLDYIIFSQTNNN